VLGTPPAFILSQDQTLKLKFPKLSLLPAHPAQPDGLLSFFFALFFSAAIQFSMFNEPLWLFVQLTGQR
jgi:hypothetical protein